MVDQHKRERNELLDITCEAIGPGANTIELLRELVERRPQGMTPNDVRQWKGLDPRDPWPQREANRLKDKLKRFRKAQGQFFDWYLELVGTDENNGVYEVLMKRNNPPPSAEGFWWPHFWMERENRIVITEPVFFRHVSDRYYIRHFDVNEQDVAQLLQKLSGLGSDVSAFVPVHHYVSIGEVNARDTIAEGLREFKPGLSVSFDTSFDMPLSRLLGGHFILTGTSRASITIQEFQRTETRLFYTHLPAGVRDKDGSEYLDQPREAYYGIVSRIADRNTRTAKTVIACNHGPATRLIAEYLFSEAVGSKLIKELELKARWEGFPDRFQIVFRVILTKESENFGNAEVLGAKVLE